MFPNSLNLKKYRQIAPKYFHKYLKLNALIISSR